MSPWFESYYLTAQLAKDLKNDYSSAAIKISPIASGALNDVVFFVIRCDDNSSVLINTLNGPSIAGACPWFWLPQLFCIALMWLTTIPFQIRTETITWNWRNYLEDSSLAWSLSEDCADKAFQVGDQHFTVLCFILTPNRSIREIKYES